MSEARRSAWFRAALGGVAVGLVLLVTGDRGALTATARGIDPLEALSSQIKPHVLVLLDTSTSMKWDVDTDFVPVGGDDRRSRFALVKNALDAALARYDGKASFGLATFQVADADKTLNRDQNLDLGSSGMKTDGLDGPLVYVSTDASARGWAGYFNGASDTFGAYSGPTWKEIFASFMNDGPFATPYPAGCASGAGCRFYVQSRLLRNGSKYQLDLTSTPLDRTDDLTAEVPNATSANCFQLEEVDPASGNTPVAGTLATYCYTSGIFQQTSGTTGQCAALEVVAVSACTAASNVATIRGHLARELADADGDGVPDALTVGTDLTTGVNPALAGLRADQGTPDGLALAAAGVFLPAPQAFQKSVIVLVTDGLTDDDLTEDGLCGSDPNAKVTTAVTEAQGLFAAGKETIVVAFGGDLNKTRADQIARAGSGDKNDAFIALDSTQLDAALDQALSSATNGGTFSAAAPILATVFELGADVTAPGVSPLNPNTRYNNRVNILYLSTFDLPGFDGHLFAFRNDGTFLPVGDTNVTGRWDAGETLFENVSQKSLEATDRGHGKNLFTFFELHEGKTARDIGAGSCKPDPFGSGTPSGCALIQRRIFTSSPVDGTANPAGSRVNLKYARVSDADTATSGWDASTPAGSNVVALWPPQNPSTTASGLGNTLGDIDPADPTVSGPLDTDLGIGAMTFAELKAAFGACDVSADNLNSGPLPSLCADPVKQTQMARKEAREVILAYTAGAKLSRAGFDGRPRRLLGCDPADTDPSSPRFCGLMYRDRGWLLLDDTLSTPAIAAPPLRSIPSRHTSEFVLFRDGRRGSDRQGIPEADKGWGLRNPDFDDTSAATKLTLKPVMTIVYIGSNDMFHAFRAGPLVVTACETSVVTCAEQGGEELWGFVPIDQLGKLKDFVTGGQVRDPHKYMVASSIRLVDVFVPSPFTDSNGVDFDGRWRTIVVFGRGAGGKFYTTLDVAAPGPYTREALLTNPPFVLWNHGNEAGVDPYDGMGETWSVPAIGTVDPTVDGSPEWRAWMGSGYGDLPNEGSTFYMLDVLTGDILLGQDVGDGTPTYFPENALVAGPSAYNPFFLDNLITGTVRSEDRVSRVYIPDIHGRIWKFNVTSGGPVVDKTDKQPFGSSLALLKISDLGTDTPHVYGESGNDTRVPLADGPFNIYGFKDATSVTDVTNPLLPLFTVPLVSSSGNRFRGTSQPTTAFNENGQGRVFFVGTRFIPGTGGTADPIQMGCENAFETILFGLTAVSGGAAYDFDSSGTADLSTVISNNRATSVQTAGGQLLIGESGAAGKAPSPSPPPLGLASPPPASPPLIFTTEVRSGTAVCRIQ